MCHLRNDLSIQIEIQKYFSKVNCKNTNSVHISTLEKMTWKDAVITMKGEDSQAELEEKGAQWRQVISTTLLPGRHDYTDEGVWERYKAQARWLSNQTSLRTSSLFSVSTNPWAHPADRLLRDFKISQSNWVHGGQQVKKTHKHRL